MLIIQNILFQVILIVRTPAVLARNRKVFENAALRNKKRMAGRWDTHLIPHFHISVLEKTAAILAGNTDQNYSLIIGVAKNKTKQVLFFLFLKLLWHSKRSKISHGFNTKNSM